MRPTAQLISEHNGWLAADLELLGRSRATVRLGAWLQTLDARAATRVRAVAPQIADQLIARGVAAEKIATIPNGTWLVGHDDAGARHEPEDTSVRKVGFLGGLTAWQGLSTLLRAWPLVTVDQPRAVLEIAGAGPARGELVRLAAALDVSGNVRFLGRVSPLQVPELLRSWDVGIVTMTAAKAAAGVSSLKLREYAAMGLPALVPDLPGFVEHSLQGWAVAYEHDNPASLANAVVDVLGDPEARLRMAREGMAYAQVHFSWNQVARAVGHVMETR